MFVQIDEIDFEKEAVYLYSFIFGQNSHVDEDLFRHKNKPTVPDSSLVAKWLKEFTERVELNNTKKILNQIETAKQNIPNF